MLSRQPSPKSQQRGRKLPSHPLTCRWSHTHMHTYQLVAHSCAHPQGGSPACKAPTCIMQEVECEPVLSHCLPCTNTYTHTHSHMGPSYHSLVQLHQVFIQKTHTSQLAARPETAYKQRKRTREGVGGCYSEKGRARDCGGDKGARERGEEITETETQREDMKVCMECKKNNMSLSKATTLNCFYLVVLLLLSWQIWRNFDSLQNNITHLHNIRS